MALLFPTGYEEVIGKLQPSHFTFVSDLLHFCDTVTSRQSNDNFLMGKSLLDVPLK